MCMYFFFFLKYVVDMKLPSKKHQYKKYFWAFYRGNNSIWAFRGVDTFLLHIREYVVLLDGNQFITFLNGLGFWK